MSKPLQLRTVKALTVFDCARGRCPAYFSDICVPVHSVAGRSRLRSADHGDLIVPRVQTQRYGSRIAFAFQDPPSGTVVAASRDI